MDDFHDAVQLQADFALSHRGEHNGDYGDVEWKSSGHLEPAEYWADVSDLRDVNAVTPSFSNNDVVRACPLSSPSLIPWHSICP